jgi:hypothetical protein
MFLSIISFDFELKQVSCLQLIYESIHLMIDYLQQNIIFSKILHHDGIVFHHFGEYPYCLFMKIFLTTFKCRL